MCNAQVMAAREESQRLFESKLEALRQASEGSQGQLSAIRSELHSALKQVDSLRGQLTRSEAEARPSFSSFYQLVYMLW